MSNSIFIFLDLYGEQLRINPDTIISYKNTGHFLTIKLPYGQDEQVQCTAEELDQALGENYFMVKKVAAAKHNG